MTERDRNGHRQQGRRLNRADCFYCTVLYEIELNRVDSTIGSAETR